MVKDKLYKFNVYIKGKNINKSFDFVSENKDVAFQEAMDKFVVLVTELTGDTITDDLYTKYTNMLNNGKLPHKVRGHILNIRDVTDYGI
jgi:hypothetical protein